MYISLLVYGRAGSGKSILASTFPKPLIIDADSSHRVYQESKAFPEAVYVQGDNCIPALQKAIEQVKNKTNKFETIVIDSLTALENIAVSALKGFSSEKWEASLYSSRGRKLGYDEWGAVSGSSIAILTELRKYPINVVIVTQMATVSDNGSEKYYPELIGKGQNESLHFSDIVGFMETTEGGRFLHLSSSTTDRFVAKARSLGGDLLPIKNPNYTKLLDSLSSPTLNLQF